MALQTRAQPVLSTPAGLWRTYDDDGVKLRGLVRITEANGVFGGVLVKNLEPGADPYEVCGKCPGERKDKPVAGLVFLTGMTLKDGEYGGGEILDPDTGTIYRCTMKLSDGGRRLIVRGYIGFSLFGRSQEWQRME